MRIVFSRKGFDSSSGGGPSPIVDGRPLSLPIPAGAASATTYGALGLGEHAAKASRGKLGAGDLCHHDPMFREDGTCIFGQHSAAQTHLEGQGVGIGDVFLFFGLFAEEATGEAHHRIFGYLRVEEIVRLADGVPRELIDLAHPHAFALHGRNDVIWRGEGRQAARASQTLRLTVPEGPPSLWRRPEWLRRGGLSYHDRADRWIRGGRLRSVARGQEFVADIGRRKAPREWLEAVIGEIRAS
ncbi:MAG: Nmad3 family putative nucleotide modification protein [Erythrobacter sp.]